MDEHVARLQDMLRSERAKVSYVVRVFLLSGCYFTRLPPSQNHLLSCQCTRLQLRCNQQEAELRRREQHSNKLKEKVSQLTDRHREKGPCETHIHKHSYVLTYQTLLTPLNIYHLAFFLSSHRGVELSAWRSREKTTAHQIVQVYCKVSWLSSLSDHCFQMRSPPPF